MLEQVWKSIAAMDEKELERAWQQAEKKAFSGCELENPRMFILSSFYYHTSPLKVLQYFGGEYIEQSNSIAKFLHDTIDDVQEWLTKSSDAIEAISKLRNTITRSHDNHELGAIQNIEDITHNIESMYISESADLADRKIRVKVLAALDVNRILDRMKHQTDKHPSMFIVSYFLMLRSLVQFASYSAAIDGTERQLGRKQAKPGDYGGYLAFLKRYFPDCDSRASKPQDLWNQIKKIFHTDGLVITCNYYKMSLVEVHLPQAKNPEGLRQVSPSGGEEILGFKAFSSLLRKLKKSSLMLS